MNKATSLLFIFLSVLLTSIAFNEIPAFADFKLKNPFYYRIITRSFLISICIIIYKKLLFKKIEQPHLFKSSIYIVPFCFLILFLSFKKVEVSANSSEIIINSSNNIKFLFSCLSVALFEELYFRVMIYKYLSSKIKTGNIIKLVIISSLIFALAHSTGFLKYGNHPFSVINQIIFAFGLGIFFQSLLLRFNNFPLVVTLHTVINYLGMYRQKLFNPDNINVTHYDFSEFLSTLITFTLAIVILILPLSYTLLKGIDKKRGTTTYKRNSGGSD